MPAKPSKPANSAFSKFWDFDLPKKIISGLLFFGAGLLCAFLLIAYFRSDLKLATELILPGALALLGIVVLFQLSRRKNSFVLILLGVALLGGLAGWGLRAYSDQVAAHKIIVLVAKFDGEEDKYAIREQILKELNTAAQGFKDVEIVASNQLVTRDQGSDYARQFGYKAQADLVVWGWYQASMAPRINLFVEDVTPAALDMPLPSDSTQPQPVVGYMGAFEIRRSFTSKSDTFSTFISGLLSYKSGNYQDFLDRFAQVLATKDASVYITPYDMNFYMAVSRTLRNETQLAIDAYNLAIKANRKGAPAYNNRALAYIDLGRFDQAVQDCTTAQIIDKQYALLYNTRGIAYLGKQEYQLAVKDFGDAIARDPGDPRAYHNRALAYQGLGQADFAAADFKKEADLRANQ